MNRLITTLLLTVLTSYAFAQDTFMVSGSVTDANNEGVVAATVILTSPRDSSFQMAAFSNEKGEFEIIDVPKGFYRLTISSVGFVSKIERVPLMNADKVFGNIVMEEDSKLLGEVQVKAKQVRVEMKGDTLQFNADAYKVNPDATADDLVKKMPGIQYQDGKLQAQGEDVKRVTVDGREFFGNDASAALKNLPAEIIDKIEVFDRLSDQSQFSGVDDGNTEKSINIVTKSGKSNGQFGKVYAGYGTDDRYNLGGNVNYFNEDLRISIIGLSNNINQTNFSSDDLLGVLGSSGSGRRGRGGRGGGSVGANSNDFLVNGQSGITNTNALGFNLTDNWGEKVKLNMSYFFNQTDNNSIDTLQQTTFLGENVTQDYREYHAGNKQNLNHRVNVRMQYDINKKNSLIFTPSLSFQNADITDYVDGKTDLVNEILNHTITSTNSNNDGYNVKFNLLYRHRFEKRGQTFSIGVGNNRSSQDYQSELLSEDQLNTNALDLNQVASKEVLNNSYDIRADYSQPLSERSSLRFSYKTDWADNESDQSTFDFNPETGGFNSLNENLSNSFLNQYNTQTMSAGYRYNKGREFMFFANLNYQIAELDGEQLFPQTLNTSRSFKNILPFAMLRYSISKEKNLRLYYRTSTNAPSITQLQNVVDNSNPLQLSAGNPNLDQESSHSLTFRYNSANLEKGSTFYAYLVGSYTLDNISNISTIATRDTVYNGIPLLRGASLSLPQNYGNSQSYRSFMTYGFPLASLKSNLNLNFGVSHSITPGLVNDLENVARNTGMTLGAVLGSNISEQVDFTLSYNGGYNIIGNTLQQDLNSNYYTQNIGLALNLLSKSGFLFNVKGTNTYLAGIEGFEQNFTLLSAKAAYKFMKKDQAELSLSAFDVLGQNNSISREITAAYVADNKSLVLNRFYMLNFTYTIRNFRPAKVRR
ncbi:outer membrane beta-barrel protein [uncultured Arcticibacterium sp.]|uniref:outer membrane beta-barrel protein n=1 Tax=uncultured Arcticibacterium sp. TaxID=2173042 RepID=UPI0030FBE19F